ncbi:hypothetical protein LUW77_28525 [Streptomyces radiopugnans]|nr:hypothetical protein LUW77_28525 [Streptomyces radiopugnans]
MARSVPEWRHAPGRTGDRWVRAGVVVWTLLGLSLLVWGLLRVLRPLAPLLWPVIVAVVIVYLLAPAVGLLERRGLPRAAGTVLVVTALVVAVTVLSPADRPAAAGAGLRRARRPADLAGGGGTRAGGPGRAAGAGRAGAARRRGDHTVAAAAGEPRLRR